MRERAQLDLKIDELRQMIANNLRSRLREGDSIASGVPSHLDRILQKDDRLLDGLQKLIPKLLETSADADDAASVEQLCSALESISAKAIRSRLNAIYRNSLSVYRQKQNGQPRVHLSEQQKLQRETLRNELAELGSEIDGLVSIVVDGQYRKPLKQGMLSAQTEYSVQKMRWAEYVVSALAYLSTRLESIHNHTERVYGHNSALQAVSALLDDTSESSSRKAEVSNSTNSASADPANGRGLKPLRLVQANLAEAQDPSFQLLRHHGLSLNEDDSASKLLTVLSDTLAERRDRLADASRATEQTLSSTIATSFAGTQQDLENVLKGVHANSRFSAIRLVDDRVQRQLDALEHDTSLLSDQMRDLDLEQVSRALSSKQAEAVKALARREVPVSSSS